MNTIKAAFLITVGVTVAYVVWLTGDIIRSFAAQAADLALLSGRVCLGSIVFVIAVAGVWWMRRQSHESMRQRDGAWALMTFWLVPWWVRLINALRGVPSPRAVYDHNLNPTHAAVIHDQVYIPVASAEQYAYAIAQEGANKLRAVSPGDASISLPWVGHAPRSPMNAPTARLMAGAYDKPAKPPSQAPKNEPTVPAQLPVRTWTPEAALNLNTRTKLAMGATPSGEVVKWDVTQAPHLRVHGLSQGSGKTNLIQTVAAGAARTGAEVVVMDRRRFKDWGAFHGCARLVDTRDPKQFAAVLTELVGTYQARDAILGQHGASNIAALEDPPRRIVAVIAEFGAACATAAAEGMLDAILYPLQLLAREAGATGVHLVVEDQVVDQRWPRGVSTNLEPVTGYLPQNYGAAGGYVYAHNLPAYTFHFSGRTFGTWPMAPVLATLLAYVRPVTVDSSLVRSTGNGGGLPDSEPVSEPTNEQASELGPTELQLAAWAWRDANPTGTQTEMRNAIGMSKGYASRCFNEWVDVRIAEMEAGTITPEGVQALFKAKVIDATGKKADAVRVDWNQGDGE